MTDYSSDRRQFLVGLTASLGLALSPFTASALESALVQKEKHGPLVLSSDQLTLIELMAEIIIPTTDTPGAKDAGVPAFLNKVVSHFLPQQQRKGFIDGLGAHHKALDTAHDQQINYVKRLDDKRWSDPFFAEFKQMVIFAYYTSEVGASQELLYDRVPGPFKELPFAEIGRSWSS